MENSSILQIILIVFMIIGGVFGVKTITPKSYNRFSLFLITISIMVFLSSTGWCLGINILADRVNESNKELLQYAESLTEPYWYIIAVCSSLIWILIIVDWLFEDKVKQ